MEQPILGFIGFGEAAYNICLGLHDTSCPRVFAYDLMYMDPERGEVIRDRASQTGVTLMDSLEQIIDKSDYILCATSAKFALSIAEQAACFTGPGKNYSDLNSASPMVKRAIAEVIESTGALFTDAAVMEIVPPNRHKVPIAASGSGAAAFTEALNSIGMNVTFISDKAGSSSSMKMFRSIFVKGVTALLLETLIASYEMGVEKEVMESISGTFTKNTLEKMANLLINRTAVNASRRISEMKDVVDTLEEMGLKSFSSEATVKRLQWLCDMNLGDYFNQELPEHYTHVLKAIHEKTRNE